MFSSKNASTNAAARKLIVHQSGQFWATSPGVDVLSALPSKAPLSLVTIIGTSRGGKSTLLNCLAGDKIFKVTNSWGKPCTAGVDISSYTMLREKLLEGNSDAAASRSKTASKSSPASPKLECPESSGSPSRGLAFGRKPQQQSSPSISSREAFVGFVDVEGQGDRDNLFDVNLALPILVCSAVVVFNWHGPLQRNTLLDGLGTLAKAGRCFDSDADASSVLSPSTSSRQRTPMKSVTTADVGADATRSRTSTMSRWSNAQMKPTPPFGHLKIVARDANSYDDDPQRMQEAWDRLMEEEQEEDAEPESAEEQEIRTRNSIRVTLRESFRSITFHPLPRIVDNPDLHKRNPRGIPAELISEGFREAVTGLRSDIYKNTAAPFTYKSLILTGPRMRTLMEKVVDFVNQGNFSVGGLWQSMQADMIQRYRDAALKIFSEKLAKIRAQLPLYSTEVLQMRLQAAQDDTIDEFDGLCESLDASSHEKSDDVVERMTAEMAKECDLVRRENQSILQEHTLYMRDTVERLTPQVFAKIRDASRWPLEFSTVTEWINEATNAALDDFRTFLTSKSSGSSESKKGDAEGITREAQVEFESFVSGRLTKAAAAEFARVGTEIRERRDLEETISSLEKYKGVMGVLSEQKKKVERMARISTALSNQATRGFLLKRGQRSFVPIWNRRYCVLNCNSIKYFKLSRAVAASVPDQSVQGAAFSLPTDWRPRRVVDLTPDTQIVVHCDLDDGNEASQKVGGEVLRSGADEEHKADAGGDVDADVSGVKNLFRLHEKEEKKTVSWPFSASSSSSSQNLYSFSIRVPLTPFSKASFANGASSAPRAQSLPTNLETRDFIFRAKSRDECRVWVTALQETIDFLRFGERDAS